MKYNPGKYLFHYNVQESRYKGKHRDYIIDGEHMTEADILQITGMTASKFHKRKHQVESIQQLVDEARIIKELSD